MNEWLVFFFINMVDWEEYLVLFKVVDFFWVKSDVWVVEVIEKEGRFYWYVMVEYVIILGKVIGVVVVDSLVGFFKDVFGNVLVINDMIKVMDIGWDDIDFIVFIDDDGQVYFFWGNIVCYYVKLKENMIEFDGEIKVVEGLFYFMEVFWIYRWGDWYYFFYVYQFLEKMAYVMFKFIEGFWEYKGILNELAGNCNINYQAIIEYKGVFYYIYYIGGIQFMGGSFCCLVCIDCLYYNEDGMMKCIIMILEGI